MKTHPWFLLISLLLAPALSLCAADMIVPVPAIPGAPASTVFQLRVNGQEVPVNDESRFGFHTAAFCLSGKVTVEITIPSALRAKDTSVIRPLRHKIVPTVTGNKITFTLSDPLKLVIKLGRHPKLALLVTPLEADVPKPSAPNVVYFGPGIHEPGVIRPQSGQTIYLAPGALVKGRLEAIGVKNVTVKGRGILDADGYSIRADKTHGILFEKCSNIKVEGIGFRAGTWWQSLFLLTDHAEVSHMNLLGRAVNTDGIDIDGVKNFVARNCFIVCADDGLGWHALDAKRNGEVPTDNALAEDCVIWNGGSGNGIRIGASMEQPLFQNITFRNIDILNHAGAALRSDLADWAWCKNIRFENIVDEIGGKLIQFAIVKIGYSNNNGYKDERGHFDGLHFVNVTGPAGGTIELRGFDADHRIDNVTFENCSIGGQPIDGPEDITANEFVTRVSFSAHDTSPASHP